MYYFNDFPILDGNGLWHSVSLVSVLPSPIMSSISSFHILFIFKISQMYLLQLLRKQYCLNNISPSQSSVGELLPI